MQNEIEIEMLIEIENEIYLAMNLHWQIFIIWTRSRSEHPAWRPRILRRISTAVDIAGCSTTSSTAEGELNCRLPLRIFYVTRFHFSVKSRNLGVNSRPQALRG
jgi:hypothetical protein